MFEGWDELFLERAVAAGCCDPELAHAAWLEFEQRRGREERVHLCQVLVRHRAITPGELVTLLGEMKELAFHCPACAASFEIRRYRLGKTYACRKCRTPLEVRGPTSRSSDTPSRSIPAPPSRGPARLGAYDVEGELGRGGMGTVYRARHRVLGHVAAIKSVARSEVEPRILERFRREAIALARIAHPNIVRFLEWGEEDLHVFYAMELVDGPTLESRIAAEPLPEAEARRIVGRIARGMHAAHEIGILHRDLKPSNIVLRGDGEPVLLDFGLVRLLAEEIESLTGSGIALGTPYYMSPEQALGEKESIDRRTDVYSLGVILYECLSGAKPYVAKSVVELVHVILEANPVPLRTRAPDVGRVTEAICRRAMASDPGDRFPTAAELADALGDPG